MLGHRFCSIWTCRGSGHTCIMVVDQRSASCVNQMPQVEEWWRLGLAILPSCSFISYNGYTMTLPATQHTTHRGHRFSHIKSCERGRGDPCANAQPRVHPNQSLQQYGYVGRCLSAQRQIIAQHVLCIELEPLWTIHIYPILQSASRLHGHDATEPRSRLRSARCSSDPNPRHRLPTTT